MWISSLLLPPLEKNDVIRFIFQLLSFSCLLLFLFYPFCLSHSFPPLLLPLFWPCVQTAAENCSGYRTCAQCLDQPGCGWCTDPSNTGKGQCMEGSYRGPFQTAVPAPSTQPGVPAPASQPALNTSMCPSIGEAKYNWSFIHCPGRGSDINARHAPFLEPFLTESSITTVNYFIWISTSFE